MEYTWYDKIISSDNLQQGDLITECPILIPPSIVNEGDEPEIEIKLLDSVILSQSCDLVNDKIQIVLVCPYITLSKWIENLPSNENSDRNARKSNVDKLRKGFLPGYHLLNKCPENNIQDYIVVDFRNVYGIQIDFLKGIAASRTERLRVLPPYREHLSQAFARYFMRVGLPQDIVVEGF